VEVGLAKIGPQPSGLVRREMDIVHSEGVKELHPVVVGEFNRVLERVGTDFSDAVEGKFPIRDRDVAAIEDGIDLGVLDFSLHPLLEKVVNGFKSAGKMLIALEKKILVHSRSVQSGGDLQIVPVVIPEDPSFSIP
jgi:hypothetical protein